MTPDELCAQLRGSLSSQYACTVTKRGALRVQTPLLLPDGDGIDVFVTEQDGRIVVSDFGDALGWLETRSRTGRLTDGQERMLRDVVNTVGVDLDRGDLSLQCDDPGSLADSVAKVGQAALRVADIWFTFRSQTFRTTAEEVDEWLRDREIPFRQRERVHGRSSTIWTVDFVMTPPLPLSYVFLLSTGDRAAARRISEHVLAACVDLSRIGARGPRPRLVSLFDDQANVWSDQHYGLVEHVSRIARWSDRLDLEEVLRSPIAAA